MKAPMPETRTFQASPSDAACDAANSDIRQRFRRRIALNPGKVTTMGETGNGTASLGLVRTVLVKLAFSFLFSVLLNQVASFPVWAQQAQPAQPDQPAQPAGAP